MTTPYAGDDVADSRSRVERAEEMLGRLGERIGGTVAGATRPVRNVAGSDADGAARPAVDRAEVVVSRLEETIGAYATVIGRRLQRLAARAREEAEDIWAEAQHVRAERGRHATEPGTGESVRAD